MAPPLVPPGFHLVVALGGGLGGALLAWLMLEAQPSSMLGLDAEMRVVLAVALGASGALGALLFPLLATAFVLMGGFVLVVVIGFVLLVTTDVLVVT